MKKITIFTMAMLLSFCGKNESFANFCFNENDSRKFFNDLFSDNGTLAVYCENATDIVDFCLSLHEPDLAMTFKKIKIFSPGDQKVNFIICDPTPVRANESSLIYRGKKKETGKKESSEKYIEN